MTTRPGRYNTTEHTSLCCVVLAQPCETGRLRIAGDYRPAASVPAAAIQLEEASDPAAAAAAAAAAITLIAGAAVATATGRIAANASTASSGRCSWTREPPAES
jgi:hypothetical protein